MERPRTLVTKDELFDIVWPGLAVSESVLTTAAKEVRQALGDDARNPQLIQTVYGRGYRFLPDVETSDEVSAQPPEVRPSKILPRDRWIWAAVAAVVLVVVAAAFLLVRSGANETAAAATTSHAKSIAVLPFEDLSPERDVWIDSCDTENSVVTLLRRSRSRPEEIVVVALNFTPNPRHNYQVGMPRGGHWAEVLNSDAAIYGGSGQGNMGGVDAVPIPLHGRRWSATITIPPLGAVFLMSKAAEETEAAENEEEEVVIA